MRSERRTDGGERIRKVVRNIPAAHRQQEEGEGPPGGGRGGDGGGDERAPSEALVILYLNAQSIVNKVNELGVVVADLEPDLILITETWCNSTITDAYLSINGYEIQQDLRKDRRDTCDGRGEGCWCTVKWV
jgi:hypothetical protein